MDAKGTITKDAYTLPTSSLRGVGDTCLAGPVLEVELRGEWILVEESIFRCWTGLRRIDGELHHGPVYYADRPQLYRGVRICPCATCQSTSEGIHRYN